MVSYSYRIPEGILRSNTVLRDDAVPAMNPVPGPSTPIMDYVALQSPITPSTRSWLRCFALPAIAPRVE